jgi:hypothetical protein
MRFQIKRTSNPSGTDADDQPSPPYIPGAEVVKRADYAWPGAVQYANIDSLEELLALGRVVVHPEPVDTDDDIEQIPVIELYDGYRE